jgi:hypothetical protein
MPSQANRDWRGNSRMTSTDILELIRENGVEIRGATIQVEGASTLSVLVVVSGRKGPMSFELRCPFECVVVFDLALPEGDSA